VNQSLAQLTLFDAPPMDADGYQSLSGAERVRHIRALSDAERLHLSLAIAARRAASDPWSIYRKWLTMWETWER
jgi:hypothetical protein